MRLGVNAILLPVLFSLLACSSGTESSDELKEEHFLFILYDGLEPSDVRDIEAELERHYERITSDLKVSDMPRLRVQMWADYDHFLEDMERDIGIRYPGTRGYVYGPEEMRLFWTPQGASGPVHEFAHLVSLRINPTIGNDPRWLWEAVAVYEAQEFVDPRTLSYMVNRAFPTLEELNTDYNSSDHKVYQVGYVLAQFIVQTWGMDTLIDLIQQNGKIRAVLGMPQHEFEAKWYQFVEEEYLS